MHCTASGAWCSVDAVIQVRGFLAIITAASSGELLRPQGSEPGGLCEQGSPSESCVRHSRLPCSGRWPTPPFLQGRRESQTLYQGSGAQPALVGGLVGEPGPDTGLAEPAVTRSW